MMVMVMAWAKGGPLGASVALAAGALAAAGVIVAPTANATCASLFGIGNSSDCTSNLTSVAIAIGTGATAHADGLFGAAFAVGDASQVSTANAFTIAAAAGNNSRAKAQGLFGIAVQLGSNGNSTAGSIPPPGVNSFGNIALNLSPSTMVSNGSSVSAVGIGTFAVNLFGNGTVLAGQQVATAGIAQFAVNLGGTNNKVRVGNGTNALNSALNIAGSGNTVEAGRPAQGGGYLNKAFNVFGSGNTVQAGPGPLAIAGSIGQTGQTVTKQQPGININGLRIPNTAAATNSRKASPAAASTSKSSAGRAAAGSARHR